MEIYVGGTSWIGNESIKSINQNFLGEKSTEFKVEKSIKQGDGITPLLILIHMNNGNKPYKNEIRNTGLGYLNWNPVLKQDLLYSNDIVPIATSEEQFQRKIITLKNKLKEK